MYGRPCQNACGKNTLAAVNNDLQAWEERLQCEEGGALTAKLVAFMLRRLNCVSATGIGNKRESLLISDKLLNHMINNLRIYSLLICDLRYIHKNSWKKHGCKQFRRINNYIFKNIIACIKMFNMNFNIFHIIIISISLNVL